MSDENPLPNSAGDYVREFGWETPMTRAEATRRLTARYHEQNERYPLGRETPLALYLRRNIPYMLRNARKRAKWARQCEQG